MEYREHNVNDTECWCEPELFFEADNGNQVWIHREPGDEQPPADLLARAITKAINDED